MDDGFVFFMLIIVGGFGIGFMFGFVTGQEQPQQECPCSIEKISDHETLVWIKAEVNSDLDAVDVCYSKNSTVCEVK